MAVNFNHLGELEYSPINVGEIESEDLRFWSKAERLLQEITEEQQQQTRLGKGFSL